MKATGIVRRIDDLGRVVIPKEIRRTLRIREGDPLEIFTDKDSIILSKYAPIKEYENIMQMQIDTIRAVTNMTVLISDRDEIILGSGPNSQNYLNEELSEDILASININSSNYFESNTEKEMRPIIRRREEKNHLQFVSVYSVDGIKSGAVILLSNNSQRRITDTERQLARAASMMISKLIEE